MKRMKHACEVQRESNKALDKLIETSPGLCKYYSALNLVSYCVEILYYYRKIQQN